MWGWLPHHSEAEWQPSWEHCPQEKNPPDPLGIEARCSQARRPPNWAE